MKHLKFFACAAALAVLCGCVGIGAASTASTRTSFPDNAFKEIPQEIRSAVDYVVPPSMDRESTGKASQIIRLGLRGEVEIIRM